MPRVRIIGGGWQSEQYDARPRNLDEAFAEARDAVERLERMGGRNALSDAGRMQLEMARNHLEDLAYLLNVKPCGICDWGSRRACTHQVTKRPALDDPKAQGAVRLLVRLGLFGMPRTSSAMPGQLELWRDVA